jgi:hypothetical protein
MQGTSFARPSLRFHGDAVTRTTGTSNSSIESGTHNTKAAHVATGTGVDTANMLSATSDDT